MTERDVCEWTSKIHIGDARETLAELPDSSVHMMMTSPPYFGLRDYGDEVNEVWGGDDDCDHEWSDAGTVKRGGQNTDDNPPDVGGNQHAQDTGIRGDGVSSDECRKCGAWRGQLGLEPQLDRFVENLVRVFREVRRVLRPDGSAWLNLGDSYAQDDASGFGAKNKMLVPHRVAIALQDDGWIVRNDVTWVKPNPMPSSVKDRLNTTTEQVFHLTPQPDYWYDLDAIREEHSERSIERMDEGPVSADIEGRGTNDSLKTDQLCNPAGKNPGDVFEVTTKPFPEAHFAVYPPELVKKPLKATCPPTVCADCGAPYEREVEDKGLGGEAKVQDNDRPAAEERDVSDSSLLRTNGRTWRKREHKGWQQTCDCETDETESGIALDPFAGAGTTCLVAKELDRRFIGVDLNPEYVAMAQQRIGLDVHDPSLVRDDAEAGLDAFVLTEGASDD